MRLTRNSDSIQAVNDTTQRVDIYVSWSDEQRTTSGAGPHSIDTGSTLLDMATLGVTTVAPATKPNGTVRMLEYYSAKAALANVSAVTHRVQLTALVNNLQTTIDLFSAPLQPGDMILYTPEFAWRVIPASGASPSTADLVQEFVDTLTDALS